MNPNTKEIETKLQDFWSKNNIYKWDSSESRSNTFVIDTPPPTVSGTLHMGHIFSYTQTDFIARYKRMIGKTVYYPMGFDDNGLPTERLVEKITNTKAISVTRNEFVSLCKNVIESEESKFRDLFRSIGLSVDWHEEYQTISNHCQKISQMSFLDLMGKGLVDRRMQPVYWDCTDQTALAQADLIDTEMSGYMYDIIFTTESEEKIIIATTRPELIFAAVAIFYHPDDKRYQHLKNQRAITPLFNIIIPIIADDSVVMDRGTGLVMCSTFGDSTDIMWWKKHNLPLRIIVSKKGTISIPDNTEFMDLSINSTRFKIIAMLKEKNLMVKKTPIKHNVKCAERSGTPIEIIVEPQWFVKILDNKNILQERINECKWHPPHMKNIADQWINGLNWDWCISRQRFFGVPFPIWYSKRPGSEGEILIPNVSDLPINPFVDLPPGYERHEVDAETDVMDTWATSSLTPQINSYGISNSLVLDLERHNALFPADLRPQSHEIIRTWTFNTIVKAHYHQNIIPWTNIMISGWCLTKNNNNPSKNEKMSKSTGNIISPINLINTYGADAVRYWASTAKLGSDVVYTEVTFAIGKKLVTKLLNACKFMSGYLFLINKNIPPLHDLIKRTIIREAMDLWLLHKLVNTVRQTGNFLEKFNYHDARKTIENFFWNDFCDNYLEIIKKRIYDCEKSGNSDGLGVVYTLYYALETVIKLFAPFVPYITEELYQMYFLTDHISVHSRGTWPKIGDLVIDEKYQHLGNMAVSILDAIRKIKANKKISLKTRIKNLTIIQNSCVKPKYTDYHLFVPDLSSVSNADTVTFIGVPNCGCVTTADGLFQVSVTL
jgi:valyl-tRNA synthetase